MTDVQLPPRLAAIADEVPICTLAADIGTDHALLPAFLLQSCRAKRVLASDIAPGPLARARETLLRHDLLDRAKLLLSDGLQAAEAYAPDVLIIAGMGGETIRNILSASDYPMQSSAYLVLQPNTHAELLRAYLYQAGFEILRERAVRQGKHFYLILVAQAPRTPVPKTPTTAELFLGALQPDTAENTAYLRLQLRRCMSALRQIQKSAQPNADRQSRLTQIIQEAERRLQERSHESHDDCC